MIDEIRAKFALDQFELTTHALDRTVLREISLQEIREAIENGEVIEDYPEDKYGPSCLVVGLTATDRPLHIQCSYPSRPRIKVITIYELDPDEWIDFRVRRK